MVRLFLFLGVFFIFYFYDLIFFFPLIISDIFFIFLVLPPLVMFSFESVVLRIQITPSWLIFITNTSIKVTSFSLLLLFRHLQYVYYFLLLFHISSASFYFNFLISFQTNSSFLICPWPWGAYCRFCAVHVFCPCHELILTLINLFLHCFSDFLLINLNLFYLHIMLLLNVFYFLCFRKSSSQFIFSPIISGLEILAFPCNQFLKQEPGTSQEAQEFACTRYKAEYPIFQKVDYLVFCLLWLSILSCFQNKHFSFEGPWYSYRIIWWLIIKFFIGIWFFFFFFFPFPSEDVLFLLMTCKLFFFLVLKSVIWVCAKCVGKTLLFLVSNDSLKAQWSNLTLKWGLEKVSLPLKHIKILFDGRTSSWFIMKSIQLLHQRRGSNYAKSRELQ